MVDYAKKKNDELATLCKERGLTHTGKKADLVKRLEESDAQGALATANKTAAEDEIDWDEPADAAAAAAGGLGEVANPVAVPNQVQVEDPSKTNDLTVIQPAEQPKTEEKDFSAGMSEISLDAEIEKRKKRALRFGLPDQGDDIKMLERAKRFGTSNLPGLLNKALPTTLDRKRESSERDGGIRKRGRGGRPGPGRGRGGGRDGGNGRTESGHASWMNEEDRRKADARKAKFASSTSAS